MLKVETIVQLCARYEGYKESPPSLTGIKYFLFPWSDLL